MLFFANVTVAKLSPVEMNARIQPLPRLDGVRPSTGASAYAQAQAAPASRPADTVSVNPLLLDMDRDHLAAFSALSEDTRNRMIDLHGKGAISTGTVESALDLALADVRQRRFTEDRQASLTDAEKAELAAIDERMNAPGRRTADESLALTVRRQEVWLGLERSEADKARGGIPIPLGHPGVQVASGRDMMENQKLRDLGVDIGRNPGFEQRLMEKLRTGEIGQTATIER